MDRFTHLWKKPFWITNAELMFNIKSMQYQIFIKNLSKKSSLWKTFFHIRLKSKVSLNY